MNFIETIAKLVVESDGGFEERLKRQDEAISELACTDPLVRKWIEAYDVEYLLASFSLLDEDFDQMFPSMAHIPSCVRGQILTAFEEHLVSCKRCSLKAAYDKELNALIDRVCLEDRDRLLQLFEDDEAVTEDEEQHGESWHANPVWARAGWPGAARFENNRMMLLTVATAVIVMLAVTLLIFHSQQQVSTLERYMAEMSRLDNSNSSMQVVELTSMLSLRSSHNEIPRISINAATAVVRFHLRMPVDEAEMTYNVAFSTDVGEVLLLRDVKRVDNYVSVSMPARLLRVGDYRLTVSSDDDPKYSYLFRVIGDSNGLTKRSQTVATNMGHFNSASTR